MAHPKTHVNGDASEAAWKKTRVGRFEGMADLAGVALGLLLAVLLLGALIAAGT